MTAEKLIGVKTLMSSKSNTLSARSVRPRSNSITLESYFNIEDSSCFNGDQYLAVMLHILYPIFVSSRQYKRYLKHGIEHGRAQRDEEETVSLYLPPVDAPNANSSVPCAQSKRLQDILLGCAAYFDESLLVKRLRVPDWPCALTRALDNHPHAVSVVDGDMIVYANKAFQIMTELSEEELLHMNLNVLNGPGTEISQLLLLQQAMKPEQTAKFAITYYTKSKRAFTDLVAVKTTAHYSVMVHFPAVKGANLDDLKVRAQL